jgi:hypothetical protein
VILCWSVTRRSKHRPRRFRPTSGINLSPLPLLVTRNQSWFSFPSTRCSYSLRLNLGPILVHPSFPLCLIEHTGQVATTASLSVSSRFILLYVSFTICGSASIRLKSMKVFKVQREGKTWMREMRMHLLLG